MSLTHSTTTITGLTVDGVETKQMTLDGNPIWAKRYTLTISQSNISGISYKLTVNRTARTDASVSTGSSDVTGSPTSYTIYYGETISFTVTATNASGNTSATPLKNNTWSGTVSGNITITPEPDLQSLLPATLNNCHVISADDQIYQGSYYTLRLEADSVYNSSFYPSTLQAEFRYPQSLLASTGCSVTHSVVYNTAYHQYDIQAYINSSSRSITVQAVYKPIIVKLRRHPSSSADRDDEWIVSADDEYVWSSSTPSSANDNVDGYKSNGLFYFYVGVIYFGSLTTEPSNSDLASRTTVTTTDVNSEGGIRNLSVVPTPYRTAKLKVYKFAAEMNNYNYRRTFNVTQSYTVSSKTFSGFTNTRTFEIVNMTNTGGWD